MTTPDAIFKDDIAKLNLNGENVYQKIFLPSTIRDFFVRAAQDSTVKHQVRQREAARFCMLRYCDILKKEDIEKWPTLHNFVSSNLGNTCTRPSVDANHAIHTFIVDVNSTGSVHQNGNNAPVTLLETSRFIYETLYNMFKDNQIIISKIKAFEQIAIERDTWILCMNVIMHHYFTEPIQYFLTCLSSITMSDIYEDTPAKHVAEFNRRFDNLTMKDKEFYTGKIMKNGQAICNEFGIPLEDDKKKSIQLNLSLIKLYKNKEFGPKISMMWQETLNQRKNTTDLSTINQSEFMYFTEKLLTLNTKSMNNTTGNTKSMNNTTGNTKSMNNTAGNNNNNNNQKKDKLSDNEQNNQVQNKMKKDMKNVKCALCGMNNHSIENCFKNSTSRNFKYCSNCNKPGHSTDDCKKRNNVAMYAEQAHPWGPPPKIPKVSNWGNSLKTTQERISELQINESFYIFLELLSHNSSE